MKQFFSTLLVILLFASCASVSVTTDYDSKADFSQKKTFAFLKEGIDRVQISDLDKKRILRNIEEQMQQKGFTLSDTPDVYVNFFTKETQRNDIYNSVGLGWGWGPFWANTTSVVPRTEGTLFIDVIDAKNKDLIWQGKGSGSLSSAQNKDERIAKFVSEILKSFPPEKKGK